VLTSWEAVDRDDERLPERRRAVDLNGDLGAAGFVGIEVVERPDWRAKELALWQEAAALDPGTDAALRSLHDEALKVLELPDLSRRVMASATL
jgi:hypothetical protein